MNRFRLIPIAAGAFLLFALFTGLGNISLNTKLSAAQTQIDDLADSLDSAAKRAAKDSADVAEASRRAAEAERVRDSIRVHQLHPRLRELRLASVSADSAVGAAPDTCQPVIAALQAEVVATQHVADTYLLLWGHEVEAHDKSKIALLRAGHALAEAQRSLAASAAKAGAIEIPRPSLWSRILPQSSVGCTAGLSPITRNADVVCGASLGWKVSL